MKTLQLTSGQIAMIEMIAIGYWHSMPESKATEYVAKLLDNIQIQLGVERTRLGASER